MRRVTKALLAITLATTLVTTAGVYATWEYVGYDNAGSTDTQMGVGLAGWTGVEILPTDTANGKKHLTFIENLRTDLNKSRSTVQGLIDDRIDRDRLNFGTMAVKGGDDLSGILGSANSNVDFLISYPQTATENTDLGSPDTYYIYSTSVGLGHRGACSGLGVYWNSKAGIHFFWDGTSAGVKHRIYEVYRTKMQKVNGTWQVVDGSTSVGSALPCWYDENKSDRYKNVTQIPSFDPSTYQEISQLPISTADNPAFAYINYSSEHGYECEAVDAHPTSWSSEKWYKFIPETASNGVVTVTLTLADADKTCNLSVYSSTDKSVLLATSENGTARFSVTGGQTYYVVVSGDTSISFTTTVS